MSKRRIWASYLAFVGACVSISSLALADEPLLEKGPRVVVVRDTIDLGSIKQGLEVDATFVLRNEGTGDLELHTIKPDCGCTVATLSDDQRIVPPGGEVTLVVTFKSQGRFGPQSPTIKVSTNDRNHPIVKLNLKCDVTTTYTISPSKSVTFRNSRRGREITQRLKLLPGDKDKVLELLEVTISNPNIHCLTEPLTHEDRRGVLLRFMIDEDAPIGDIVTKGLVRFRVGEETDEVILRIRGSVVGDLTYRPAQIVSLRSTERGTALPPWTVTSTARKPFIVRSVDAGPYLTTTIVPRDAAGTEYRISLTVALDAPAGPLAALLKVVTDTPEQPMVEVPVFVRVAEAVTVDPLLVRLIHGGPVSAGQRRVRITSTLGHELQILGVECDLPFVMIEVLPLDDQSYGHRRLIVATLTDNVPPGDHRGSLTLRTNVAGAATLILPLEVEFRSDGASTAAGS